MNEEKYRFLVEWFDETIKVKRKFILCFYPSDNSVDMYDTLAKRTFLRRMKCNSVQLSDLFIGSIVNVLSRQLYIIDFADKKTVDKFSYDVEETILIINESGFKSLGNIISVLEKNNLTLSKGKMIDKDKSGFNSSSFCEVLEGNFLVLEMRGENAVNIVRKLLNPEAPIERPLRADMSDLSQHCVGPSEGSTAKKEIKIFFPASREVHCNTVHFINSIACIIKPHAVREKISGRILQDILNAGFQISALEIITFNQTTASEFYDVYKGVIPEYKDMVAQLISGPCIALEVTGSGNNVKMDFRTFVGPADPEIARKLRSGTLRASYGQDKIKNAVHCTDLPDDTLLELDYIFKILPA